MEKFGHFADAIQLLQDVRDGKLEGRDALEKLAATKQFLFHGSPVRLESLEPRQAYNEGMPDGAPAVFAASDEGYELAIFKSLMRTGTSQFATENAKDGRWDFGADEKALAYARSPDAEGFVHIFKKSDFTHDTRYQWRSEKVVLPILVVRVTAEDLPEDIATIEGRKE